MERWCNEADIKWAVERELKKGTQVRNEEMCRERSAGRLRPSCGSGSGPGPAPGQGDSPRLRPPGPPTRRAPAPRITRVMLLLFPTARPPGARLALPAARGTAGSASAAMSAPPVFPVPSGPHSVPRLPAALGWGTEKLRAPLYPCTATGRLSWEPALWYYGFAAPLAKGWWRFLGTASSLRACLSFKRKQTEHCRPEKATPPEKNPQNPPN